MCITIKPAIEENNNTCGTSFSDFTCPLKDPRYRGQTGHNCAHSRLWPDDGYTWPKVTIEIDGKTGEYYQSHGFLKRDGHRFNLFLVIQGALF